MFVESGSNLSAGAIVSGDGLILTTAAPLRVRFSAEQTLPAKVVALDKKTDVALLHVAAHTDATCLALRESPLPEGEAVFGISSELSEDRAFSLTGGVRLRGEKGDAEASLRVDPLLARAAGGALLDAQGRLVGIVAVASPKSQPGGALGLEAHGGGNDQPGHRWLTN